MKKIFIRPRTRACYGHVWVYRNEIVNVEGEPSEGDVVDLFTSNGVYLGKAYYNPVSKISARIVTRRNEPVNKAFFVKRFRSSFDMRRPLLQNSNACRVVFSEADGLPGLVVDLFDRHLVIQVNTLGMERLKPQLVDALVEVFEPQGIFEKDDAISRKKEGLETEDGWIWGSGPELVPFEMNGLKFYCDTKGQKTGFYLDQRWNARIFGDFAFGRVLDAFSYTGSFGIHALANGAEHVVFLDYSERALEVAKENVKLNGFDLDKVEFVHANAFDYLKSIQGGIYFDAISLDPPSLARSPHSFDAAFRGYKELNLRAMKLLKNGGLLGTSSCTRIVSRERFEEVLASAAKDTRVDLTFVHVGGQPPDHPIKQAVPETFYLKSYLVSIERR